jgi:hypothetical protein
MAGDTSGVLQLATNGSTTAVTVDTSQNVGIGTTSPSQRLHVTSNNGQILAEATGASQNPSLKLKAATNNRDWEIFSWSGSAGQFGIYDGVAGQNRLIIDSSGNVGIGTSSPSTYGSGLTVTNRIMPQATPSTNWGIDFATDTGGNNYVSIAAGATYNLAVGGGLILVNDNTIGDSALYLTYNGNVTKIAGGALFVSGAGGANQIGLAWNGSTNYRFNNGYAASHSLWIGTFRIRQAN